MAKKEPVGVQLPAMGLIAASLLSGAMLAISAMIIPVFLDTNSDPAHLVRQWSRLYDYGKVYMPSASLAASLLFACAAVQKRPGARVYAAAGIATFAMVPFTSLIVPTNSALFALGDVAPVAVEGDVVRGLIAKWSRLHLARSAFPLVGAVLGLVGVVQELSQ